MSQTPVLRNPAPHRGFNSKAREVLLDSPLNYCMRRSGSDEEFLRRVGLIRFRRAGSEEMTVESGGSTPSVKAQGGFDELDALPKFKGTHRKSQKSARMLLSDIGKTRSVGDLSKRLSRASISIKTLQQMVVAVPSSSDPKACADETHHLIGPSSAGSGKETASQQQDTSKRTAQYKME